MPLNQLIKYVFESDPVQGITWMRSRSWHKNLIEQGSTNLPGGFGGRVRPPKLADHFALRGERAFGRGDGG